MGEPIKAVLDVRRRSIMVNQKLDDDFEVERAILVRQRAREVMGVLGGELQLVGGVGIIGDANDEGVELRFRRALRCNCGGRARDANLG
jgi:hypothetical protein